MNTSPVFAAFSLLLASALATSHHPLGKFRPTCTEEGEYSPVQCHGSTGYCWCVDMNGNELPGTRVFGQRPTCQPMTECLVLLSSTQPMPGAFIPSCEEDGSFSRVQCHGSTGHCWCSDPKGNEVQGTRQRGTPDCSEVVIPETVSLCEAHAAESILGNIGGYRPQCDEDGEYIPMQCHGGVGMCWCVDTKGNELLGTRMRGHPECDRVTPCMVEAALIVPTPTPAPQRLRASAGIVGRYRAQCTESGEFEPVQCHGSTGYCWCVDMDGNELPGTRLFGDRPNCQRMTDCLLLSFRTTAKPGAFMPSCEADGAFSRVQCHGSTGHCWCADKNGMEVPNTRIRGTPDCSVLDTMPAPLTDCQVMAAAVTPGLLGAYRPQCDDNGNFLPRQCHGGAGMCWCVDTDGSEIAGTRIRGDYPACQRATACMVSRYGPSIALAQQ